MGISHILGDIAAHHEADATHLANRIQAAKTLRK